MARVSIVVALVLVMVAIGAWWRVARDMSPLPRSAVASPPPRDARAPEPDAFDLRGDVVELPAGVKFIVPPRLAHDWVNEGHRSVVFGDGERLVALVNVTKGAKLRKAANPTTATHQLARRDKLAITASEDYAPGRTYFRLDGEERGVQVQHHMIFIELPKLEARVSLFVKLTGPIILDPRIGELVSELRGGRVITP